MATTTTERPPDDYLPGTFNSAGPLDNVESWIDKERWDELEDVLDLVAAEPRWWDVKGV